MEAQGQSPQQGVRKKNDLDQSLYLYPEPEKADLDEYLRLRQEFAQRLNLASIPDSLPIEEVTVLPDGNGRATEEVGTDYNPGGQKAVEIARLFAMSADEVAKILAKSPQEEQEIKEIKTKLAHVTVFKLWLLSLFNVLFRSPGFFTKVNSAFVALAMSILTKGELIDDGIQMNVNNGGLDLLATSDFDAERFGENKANASTEQRTDLAHMIHTVSRMTELRGDKEKVFQIGIGDDLDEASIYIRTGVPMDGTVKASGLKLKGKNGIPPIIISITDLFPVAGTDTILRSLGKAQDMYGKLRRPTKGHKVKRISEIIAKNPLLDLPNGDYHAKNPFLALPPGSHTITIPYRPDEFVEVQKLVKGLSDNEETRRVKIALTDLSGETINSGFKPTDQDVPTLTYRLEPFDPDKSLHYDAIIAVGQLPDNPRTALQTFDGALSVNEATFFVLPEDIGDSVVFASGRTNEAIWGFIQAAIDHTQKNPSLKGGDRKKQEKFGTINIEDIPEYNYFEYGLPRLIRDGKVFGGEPSPEIGEAIDLKQIAETIQKQYLESPNLFPDNRKEDFLIDLFVLSILTNLRGLEQKAPGILKDIPYDTPELVRALQSYMTFSGYIAFDEKDPSWPSTGAYHAYNMANAMNTDEIYDTTHNQSIRAEITHFLAGILETGRGRENRRVRGKITPKGRELNQIKANLLKEFPPAVAKKYAERLWEAAGIWDIFRNEFKDTNPDAFNYWKKGQQRFYGCCRDESEPSITHNTNLAGKLERNDIASIREEYEKKFAAETPKAISQRIRGLLENIEQKKPEDSIQERCEIRFWFYFLKVYESIGAGNVYRTHALTAQKEEITPHRLDLMENISRLSDSWNRIANDMAGRLGQEDDKKEDAFTVMERVYREAMGTADNSLPKAIAMGHVKKIYDWLGEEFNRALKGDVETEGLEKEWPYLARAVNRGMIGLETYKVEHPKRIDRHRLREVMEKLDYDLREGGIEESDGSDRKLNWQAFQEMVQKLIKQAS